MTTRAVQLAAAIALAVGLILTVSVAGQVQKRADLPEIRCPWCSSTYNLTPEDMGAVAAWVSQEQQKTTDPEWVAIFDLSEPSHPPKPWANIRVLVRADREGEAILKAHKFLDDHLSAAAMDKLKFVEAQQKEGGK